MIPNCPTCAGPMIEGFVVDRGHGVSKHAGVWAEGRPEYSFYSFFNRLKLDRRAQFVMQAFRCPNCGLVHLYAHERTN